MHKLCGIFLLPRGLLVFPQAEGKKGNIAQAVDLSSSIPKMLWYYIVWLLILSDVPFQHHENGGYSDERVG
jgi:hypothetical protein